MSSVKKVEYRLAGHSLIACLLLIVMINVSGTSGDLLPLPPELGGDIEIYSPGVELTTPIPAPVVTPGGDGGLFMPGVEPTTPIPAPVLTSGGDGGLFMPGVEPTTPIPAPVVTPGGDGGLFMPGVEPTTPIPAPVVTSGGDGGLFMPGVEPTTPIPAPVITSGGDGGLFLPGVEPTTPIPAPVVTSGGDGGLFMPGVEPTTPIPAPVVTSGVDGGLFMPGVEPTTPIPVPVVTSGGDGGLFMPGVEPTTPIPAPVLTPASIVVPTIPPADGQVTMNEKPLPDSYGATPPADSGTTPITLEGQPEDGAKSGDCPADRVGRKYRSDVTCSRDSDCAGKQKCCSRGGRMVCRVPAIIIPGTCPEVMPNNSGQASKSNCDGDYDCCNRKKKCCPNETGVYVCKIATAPSRNGLLNPRDENQAPVSTPAAPPETYAP